MPRISQPFGLVLFLNTRLYDLKLFWLIAPSSIKRIICGVSSGSNSPGILVPSDEQKHHGSEQSSSSHFFAISGGGVVVGGAGVDATGPQTASFLYVQNFLNTYS